MPCTLHKKAYQQLFDEDLDWLLKQPRSLERDHIEQCLRWMRANRENVDDAHAEVRKRNAHAPGGAEESPPAEVEEFGDPWCSPAAHAPSGAGQESPPAGNQE